MSFSLDDKPYEYSHRYTQKPWSIFIYI